MQFFVERLFTVCSLDRIALPLVPSPHPKNSNYFYREKCEHPANGNHARSVDALITAFICGVGKAKRDEAVSEGHPADTGSCEMRRFYIRWFQLSAARCR